MSEYKDEFEDQIILEKICNLTTKKPKQVGNLTSDCTAPNCWVLADNTGGSVVLNYNDWELLSAEANDVIDYYSSAEFYTHVKYLLNAFCKDCKKDCMKCTVMDFNRMIMRRIGNDYDFGENDDD